MQAFERFLEEVADYAATKGISGNNIFVTGHSLGGGAANQLREFSTSVAGGYFTNSNYVTFASPLVFENSNVYNFGFDNDFVYKSVNSLNFGERDYANSADNVIFVTGASVKFNGPEIGLAFSFGGPDHAMFNYRATINALVSSDFFPFTSRDSYIAISPDDVNVIYPNISFDQIKNDIPSASTVFYLGSTLPNKIFAGPGSDFIDGGRGGDSIYGADGADRIWGGAGRDDLRGEGWRDILDGGGDDDQIYGGPGNDDLLGGDNADTLKGEGDNDSLVGGYGGDSLLGDEGADTIYGGAGNDTIEGGSNLGRGDVAVYDLSIGNYHREAISGGFVIRATHGSEGTDTILGVETFVFGGVTFDDRSILPSTAPPGSGGTTAELRPAREVVAPPPPPSPSGPPEIYSGPFIINEHNSGERTHDVRVYLTKPSTNAISFDYLIIGRDEVGWAKTNIDVKLRTGTGIILAGETFVDIPVTVIGDTRVEKDEKFTILLSNPWNAKFATGEIVYLINGMVKDNDAPSTPPPEPPPPPKPTGPIYLALEADDASLLEGATGTFTEFEFDVRRTGDLSVETRVRYEVLGFGAAPADGSDFDGGSLPTGTVTFSPGDDKESFRVRVKGDALQEANEAFQVRITPRNSGVKVTDGEAAVTIRNDDGTTLPSPAGPVYVSVRAVNAIKPEGTGPSSSSTTPFEFEVRREGDLNQETQVGIGLITTGSTPQAGALTGSTGDFAVSGYTVTFGIGESVVTRTFQAKADSVNEPNEPFTVRLSKKSGYENVIFTDRTAEGLILNDDGPAPPLVTAPAVSFFETDSDRTVNLRVQLSAATTVPVTMDYEVYGWESSQAPVGVGDFAATTGTLTISAGATFANIPIVLKGDDLPENLEVIDVRLKNVVNGYFGRSIREWDTAVLILDDDGSRRWPGGPGFSSADYIDLGTIEPYSQHAMSYWLDDASPFRLFSFVVEQPLIVQAIPFASPQILFSSSGEVLQANVSRVDGIEIIDVSNALAEGAVLGAGRYFMLMERPAAVGQGDFRIALNGVPTPDQLPMLRLDGAIVSTGGIDYPALTGPEGIPGLISFKLSLEQPTDVSFDVEFRGISATPEVDFTATPLRVTIQAGDTYESESVYVFNDDIFEGPETFEIIIKNVVGARLPNGQSEWAGTYLIADTDLSPVPAFTIRSLSGERAEGTGSNGLFSFEVSRPYGGEGTAANVSWQVMGSGANPASVTDFAGGEFPAGSLSRAGSVCLNSSGAFPKCIPALVRPPSGLMAAR